MNKLKYLAFCLLAVLSVSATGQEREPESFMITADQYQHLLSQPAGAELDMPTNPYLDNGIVEMNTLNGDMRFVRAQLKSFPDSYLIIQVNGSFSTQAFIMPKEKTVSRAYKGTFEKGSLKMEKCTTDDIVNE